MILKKIMRKRKKRIRRERLSRLKKRMAETLFIRRGLALTIDFMLIALISIPIYTALLFFLSSFDPEYKKPVENLKRILSLKPEDESLSPLGEFVLKKSEEKLEKQIGREKKMLEERSLDPEKRQSLEEKIKGAEKKLDEIRRTRLERSSEQEPEQKLKEELAKTTGSVVFPLEKFSWIQEILVAYTYFTLFFFFGGRTPGKRIMKLKVVKRDGSKLSFWGAFERTHGYAYSASLALIGFLQVLWDKEAATMHDKIAGTNVIRRRLP